MYVKSFPSVPKQGFVNVRINAQPWCFGRKQKATTDNHEKAILHITIAIVHTWSASVRPPHPPPMTPAKIANIPANPYKVKYMYISLQENEMHSNSFPPFLNRYTYTISPISVY